MLEERFGAEPGVTFVGRVSRPQLRWLYREAAAVVFCAHEDFGIVPIEAQAAGTPVVALAAGGSIDTVRNAETGVLVPSQTVDAFRDGILAVVDRDEPLDPEGCRAHAQDFSYLHFRERIRDWTATALAWSS